MYCKKVMNCCSSVKGEKISAAVLKPISMGKTSFFDFFS